MIILVTGQPGSGKTLYTVDRLANDPQFQGRPLVVMGIPELALDHDVPPPVEQWTEMRPSPEDESLLQPYFTFPEGAVVVIDEAQRVFRPRGAGSAVPAHVAAFETHRHVGIDFILITQQAGLIDSNIRKLIGRHIHIKVTPVGSYRYEWLELGDPESSSSRQIAARSRYKLPARSFSLYKSSQLHTKIKPKIPGYLLLIPLAAVVLVVLGITAYSSIASRNAVEMKSDQPARLDVPQARPSGTVLSTSEYLETFQPRITGLPHTAPRYDELTKPSRVPFPAGCFKTAKVCKCLTDQGTIYDTTPGQCQQFIKVGLPFKEFDDSGTSERPKDSHPSALQTAGGNPRSGGAQPGGWPAGPGGAQPL